MLTEVGVNVPPFAASLGVTIIVPVIAPFAAIVKLVDADPFTPDVGPVIITVVANAKTLLVMERPENVAIKLPVRSRKPFEAG